MRFYGVPPEVLNATTNAGREVQRSIMTYLRRNAGPARDGLPAAAPDNEPPGRPGRPQVVAVQEGLVVKWKLASDNVAVLGYTLQVRWAGPRCGESGAACVTHTHVRACMHK